MNKLLFLLVALLTNVGVWAFEVDGIIYTIVSAEDNTVQVTGYNSNYNNLVINGVVSYENVEYKVVSIQGTKTAYGMTLLSPFYQCGSLKSIGDLPYCLSIENGAFKDCWGLTSVGDLSACTSIGDEAFSECSKLASVGDLSACTSIGASAFYKCSNLASVDLSACTSIGFEAFSNCSNLASVGNLSACTSIGGYAFRDCSSLASVGNLSVCTSIGGSAFQGCSSLSSVGDLSVCTYIGSDAFIGFEKVTISNTTPPTLYGYPADASTTFIVPASALEAYRAAEGWSDIKFQIIADNATTEYDINAPILNGVGASNLTNVMKLKVTGDIDSEDIMFIRNNMVNLHHLDLTDANYVASTAEYASGKTTADNSVGGLYGLLRLRSVKLPESAKRIEGDAFDGCSYLSNITIPEGIERIEDGGYNNGTYRGAFTGCPITSITLPNSITYIGEYNQEIEGETNVEIIPVSA